MTIVVLDNGASAVKAGVTSAANGDDLASDAKLITNAIVRSKGDRATYIGHELESCRDFASLHYRLPFEKGYLVDWDAQKAVWDGLFSSHVFGVNPGEAALLLTEPYFNLPNIQDVYDQFVFEEYEFQSCVRAAPAAFIPFGGLFSETGFPEPECMVVVDCGFSFTHVVPILNGSIVWGAVTRIDVGGKLLTNQLKELISFRQWNMMDETHVMNEVKETCCYVTSDLRNDMEVCRVDPKRNSIVQEYILPNFASHRHGRVRTPGEALAETDQVLYMNNERFLVPELLFRPDDIGLRQTGLPGAIARSVALLPEDVRGLAWANIGLIGGSTRFPGLRARLLADLRTLAPIDCELDVRAASDPITEAYRSALAFARSPAFVAMAVTRAEYLESGSSACRRKFRGWNAADGAQEKGKAPARVKARTRPDQDEEPASIKAAGREVSRRKSIRGRG